MRCREKIKREAKEFILFGCALAALAIMSYETMMYRRRSGRKSYDDFDF